MRCQQCGRELDGSGRCAFCSESLPDGRVRVLSREEKVSYDGVTIEENPDGTMAEEFMFRRQGRGFEGKGIRYGRVWLGVGRTSWVQRIAAVAIIAGVLAFLFFVALPVLLFVLVLGAVIGLLSSMRKGK